MKRKVQELLDKEQIRVIDGKVDVTDLPKLVNAALAKAMYSFVSIDEDSLDSSANFSVSDVRRIFGYNEYAS